MTLKSWVYVLDEKLNWSKRAEETNLSKSLKKLNRSKLSKELNKLKSMNNIEELEHMKRMMIQSFSSSWIYSCKTYISLVCSWRRSRMLSRVIWYFEMMNHYFSLRETSCSEFVDYWFSSRESFLSIREHFLRVMIYFNYYWSRFLEFSKCKKMNELKEWVLGIKSKRLKSRIIMIIEN